MVDWPSLQECSAEESNEIAFQIFEKEFNIQRMMTSEESLTLENIDIKNWLHYLELICEVFRGEIPHVKHPKLDYAEFQKQKNQNATTMAGFAKLHRMAAAKREAAKEENGASQVVPAGGRRTQKLVIAEKVPSELKEKLTINEGLQSKSRKIYKISDFYLKTNPESIFLSIFTQFRLFFSHSRPLTSERRAPSRPKAPKLRKIRKHCKFLQKFLFPVVTSHPTIPNHHPKTYFSFDDLTAAYPAIEITCEENILLLFQESLERIRLLCSEWLLMAINLVILIFILGYLIY